ncbi:MAG: hypothetical protein KJO24_04660, partial [Gammaproteobacteria bacterium]|nr:hypothetical protein [Gammaproteobacteria bacterium]
MHSMLAIWFFVGRYYAGDLSAYSAQLEAQLATATALEWKLEQLRLEWRGLNPVVSVGRMEAAFSQQNTADNIRTPVDALLQKNNIEQLLLVKDAEFYIDVVASLWHRQPMLHGLRATEIHFTLEKTAGNQLLLAGLQRGGASDFNAQQFINHFQYADVQQLSMRLVDSGNGAALLHQPAALQFSLDNQLRLRRLLVGTLPDTVESSQVSTFDASTNGFALQAISDGRFLSRESSLRAHFFARGARSSAWFNLFSGGWVVADLDMQLWLSKNKFGRIHGHGRVDNAAFRQRKSNSRGRVAAASKTAAWPTSVERMGGDVTLRWAAIDDFRLAWHELSLTTQAREVQLPDGALNASHDWLNRRHLAVTLPQWNLRPLLRDAQALQILPASVDNILRSIDPDGMLQEIELLLPENNSSGWEINATVQGLATKPWKGAPGVTGLSGQLLIGAREGRFELHSEQQLSLLFPKVYRQSHTFGRASGSVRWSMQADRLLIDGSDMALQSVDGAVDYGAAFTVNARTKANTPASSLRLRIGFTNGQLDELAAFVPYTLPPGLRDWIAQSNASGRVSEGGFIYNGSLKKGDAANRNIKLYFDLDGASANYAAEWPPAQAMHGRVMIAPARSSLTLDSLSVRGLPLTNARIDLHTGTTRKFVQVDTTLAGNLSSALQLLQTMPLASKINRVIGSWQGSGELQQGSLRLRVPISGKQLTVEQLDFAAHLHNANLQMRNLDLSVDKLNGPITYDLNRGLQSPGLDSQLWGKPWQLKLGDASSSQSGTAAGNIFLQASGTAEISSIQRWLRQPVLGFASGTGNFSLQLEQSPKRSVLSLNSDLLGVALEAPLPFYKLATSPLPLTLDWDFGRAGQPMSLALPGMLHAQFEFEQFNFSGGELTLLDDAGAGLLIKKAAGTDAQPDRNYRQGELIVNGSLATFNLAAWQNALQRYQRFAGTAQDPLPAHNATVAAA